MIFKFAFHYSGLSMKWSMTWFLNRMYWVLSSEFPSIMYLKERSLRNHLVNLLRIIFICLISWVSSLEIYRRSLNALCPEMAVILDFTKGTTLSNISASSLQNLDSTMDLYSSEMKLLIIYRAMYLQMFLS